MKFTADLESKRIHALFALFQIHKITIMFLIQNAITINRNYFTMSMDSVA